MNLLKALGLGMVAALIAALVYPVFGHSGHSGLLCRAHLKRLSLLALTYAEDHDDRFPISARSCDSLASYVPSDQEFRCTESVSRYGFAMHDSLSAFRRGELLEPEKRMLLFHSRAMVRNAHGDESLLPNPGRHGNRNSVAYADGHVRTLPSPLTQMEVKPNGAFVQSK